MAFVHYVLGYGMLPFVKMISLVSGDNAYIVTHDLL